MYDPVLGRWTQPNTVVPVGVQGVQAWTGMRMLINRRRGLIIRMDILSISPLPLLVQLQVRRSALD
jgi:hypothetical protein